MTADGKPVEDNGRQHHRPTATCDRDIAAGLPDRSPAAKAAGDPDPKTSVNLGSVILTNDPAKCQPAPTPYCGAPGSQLYYFNTAFPCRPLTNSEPSGGNICVDKRDNAIPDYVIDANKQAHAAMSAYFKQNGIRSAPWLAYKLVNVQYFPYDKIITNPTFRTECCTLQSRPTRRKIPRRRAIYQANIVVETNRSLQLFSGGLSPQYQHRMESGRLAHKNTYLWRELHNMGGCMGCHGSQGQNPAKGWRAISA